MTDYNNYKDMGKEFECSNFNHIEFGEPEYLPESTCKTWRALQILGDDCTKSELLKHIFYGSIKVFDNSRNPNIALPISNVREFLSNYFKICTLDNDSDVFIILNKFNYSVKELSEFEQGKRKCFYSKVGKVVNGVRTNIDKQELSNFELFLAISMALPAYEAFYLVKDIEDKGICYYSGLKIFEHPCREALQE